MSILKWEKRYELGIEQFDEHHRHLLNLLNSVYRKSVEFGSSESLAPVIQELKEYASYHFTAEENLMSLSGYEALSLHREEHKKFAEMVTEFDRELESGNDISLDLISFLGNWLFDHILFTDADYCPSINRKTD